MFDLSKSEYTVSPHFTKSSKKKEGQGPIVKIGWIGRDLRIILLLLAPPSPWYTDGNGLARVTPGGRPIR